MKKVLLLLGIVCLMATVHAQTLPSITSATVNQTPADSSGSGKRVLEILLPSLDNVDKVHVTILGSGNAVLHSNSPKLSDLTVWERGTKANPQGFALYITLPAPAGNSGGGVGNGNSVKVELANAQGNKGNPTIAVDNN